MDESDYVHLASGFPMATAEEHDVRTNWPVKLYIGGLLFAFVSLVVLTPALDGAVLNAARGAAQLAICGLVGLRLAWAIYRREQSKAWIPYVAGLFFAVPIWLLVEPLILSLGS